MMLLALVWIGVNANAQILDPVTWTYAAKKTGTNEAVLFIKAKLQPGWHIYSQHVGEGGPVKTTFAFTPGKDYETVGATMEPKPIEKFEKVFNMEVSYFDNEVVFQQKIKLKAGQATVKGTVEYMVCNDTQCLPPEERTFSITVK